MDLKPGKKPKCPKCSRTFKTDKQLTKHMVKHEPNVNVKCHECGKISKTRLALYLHVRSVHSTRERPSCDTCHRVFFDLPTLREHINTVHNPKDRPHFPCTFPGCQKTYLNKRHLSRHANSEHAVNPVRYPCTLCGKEFKTSAHLERHISTHTTEKTHNCATCGRSFAQKSEMKLHEKTHLEKSTRDVLKCHVCSQAFITRRGLRRHIRVVHENQRNHPCEFCGKTFPSAKDLERHVEARHAENKDPIHSCDKCEYRSHSKHNLTRHARRHWPANHECYFCGKKFLTLQELVKHSNRTHTLEK